MKSLVASASRFDAMLADEEKSINKSKKKQQERQLDEMLAKPPRFIYPTVQEKFYQLEPLTCAIFAKESPWYVTAGSDPDEVEYREWTDEDSNMCYGQVSKATGKKHGIVRRVQVCGWLQEAQWEQGTLTGYGRQIRSDGEYYTYYYDHCKPHGLTTRYDQNDKVVFIRHYDKGHLIKTERPGQEKFMPGARRRA